MRRSHLLNASRIPPGRIVGILLGYGSLLCWLFEFVFGIVWIVLSSFVALDLGFDCLNGLYRFDCLHWFLEDLGQSWLFVLLLVLGWTVCSVSIMDLFRMLDSLGCVNYFLDWVGLFWLFDLVVRCVGSPVRLIVSWICLGRLGCVRCPDWFLLDYLYWLS